MKWLDMVVMILLIVGGLNWGLVGAFDFDVVAKVFGAGSVVSRVVYVAIGLSALYQIFQMRHGCCAKDH